ncbi:hypothetical protein ACUSIJ_00315 [Pseudochelatococcus sp. B33]
MEQNALNTNRYFALSLCSCIKFIPKTVPVFRFDAIAFSSEADTGSREENAPNQKVGAFQHFRETMTCAVAPYRVINAAIFKQRRDGPIRAASARMPWRTGVRTHLRRVSCSRIRLQNDGKNWLIILHDYVILSIQGVFPAVF